MSSPAHPTLRSPGESVPEAGATSGFGGLPHVPRPAAGREEWPCPAPHPSRHAQGGGLAPAVLRIACSAEGFARARVFTRDTLNGWSLGRHADDAVLVITELASNAVSHALPSAAAGAPEIRLGLAPRPSHLMLTVSDPGDNAPVFAPSGGSALQEHGRGLCIVDALAEEWGWTPRPPAGKTVWAKLSTRTLT
uniref:Putative regulator n=1 Tax=Streptomyces ambofaciens (strain ATCC 23877 / 3486 / DSM 40053 / JCM 4204 / NBRC 12836 / NRRL B-2516) TaxID=278992 RepID=A0AD94_STRA7|nr:ATP-binding protein [Streptomyces ambofaciens]CAJ88449.1 putative regulator [Streptomyces ambofaciens ATCC 23877]